MRCRSEEDYDRIIAFLELEREYDRHNREMLKDTDLTHMATNKKTGKLTGESLKRIKVFQSYAKASNALIKKFKTTFNKKESYERMSIFGRTADNIHTSN